MVDSMGAELLAFGTATIFAAHPRVRVLPERIRRVAGIGCAGPVRAVMMRAGDNLALHHAIHDARPGDVLVGAVDGGSPGGYFGEIMALACRVKRIAGVVLDATVRDVDELRSLALPVFATGTCLTDTTKRFDQEYTPGFEIRIDRLTVRDGDWIVADGTAIVHVPQAVMGEVIRTARSRFRKEEAMRTAILQGVPTLDLLEGEPK